MSGCRDVIVRTCLGSDLVVEMDDQLSEMNEGQGEFRPRIPVTDEYPRVLHEGPAFNPGDDDHVRPDTRWFGRRRASARHENADMCPANSSKLASTHPERTLTYQCKVRGGTDAPLGDSSDPLPTEK
jgi:hypothetical protein